MRKSIFFPLIFLALATLQSCELAGDIFKAGWWSALIVVGLVIVLVIWLIGRARR